MANLLDKNQLFHFLSKSPVGLDTTLDAARNKSGHTLTTDDIFGEEIPACFVPETEDQLKIIPKSSLHKNDLAAIAYGSTSVKCYYYDGTQWVKRTESWKDNELFFNRHSSYINDGSYIQGEVADKIEEEAVIVYRKERKGFFITSENNNTAGSGKMSVRVLKKTDTNISAEEISAISAGDFVPQFLQSTDKFVNGTPSIGYNPLVYNEADKNGLVEDENDSGAYVSNSYAGVIQFNDTTIDIIQDGKNYLKDIVISVWEYVGKTLTEVLSGFATVDSGFNYRVLTTEEVRPAPSADLKGWIYFEPASIEEDNNIYNEFICVDDKDGWKWEQIGSTAITIPDPPKAGDYLKLENDTYSVKTSTKIEDNDYTVPTTSAVYEHVNKSIPKAGDYLELEKNDDNTYSYNVKYTDEIKDESDLTEENKTIPTTQAVYKFFNDNKEKVSHNTIFDLNKFVAEHAHVRWVQKMILWGDGDNLNNEPVEENLAWDCGNDTSERRVYIPHCTTFYGNVSQKEAKIQWIKDAMNGVVETQLVFHLDSHWTYRIIKHMFWQLDEDAAVLNPNAPKYGQEGSITKTYMKPGVTVRYMAFLEDDDWTDSDYDFDAKMSIIDEDNTG
jgi:hypothetical protein